MPITQAFNSLLQLVDFILYAGRHGSKFRAFFVRFVIATPSFAYHSLFGRTQSFTGQLGNILEQLFMLLLCHFFSCLPILADSNGGLQRLRELICIKPTRSSYMLLQRLVSGARLAVTVMSEQLAQVFDGAVLC